MRQPLCFHGHPYPRTAEWDENDDLSDEFQAERETDEDDEEISDDDPTELW